MNLRNANAVSKLLSRAKDIRLVRSLIDDGAAARGDHDQVRSQELRDEFELSNARVIQPDMSAAQDSDGPDDNYLHTALANTSEITERIPEQSVLGIGPGRGPYQWASAVRRKPPSRAGVKIISLSGRVLATFWRSGVGGTSGRPLDADDAVIRLHEAFEHEPSTQYRLVGLPAIVPEGTQMDDFLREQCPFKPGGSWDDRVGAPQFAVIGAGALRPGSGHRIVQAESESESAATRSFGSKGRELMKQASDRGLTPLGDLVNRFFPTLPLPADLRDASATELEELENKHRRMVQDIATFDERLVAANWSHLRSIGKVIVIAGGEHKHHTLWSILLNRLSSEVKSNQIVDEVVTDLKTAEVLIQAKKDYLDLERRNPAAFDWLRRSSRAMFS